VLLLVVLAWAMLLARGRRASAMLAGIAFAVTATGFWVLTLERPYGLFDDPGVTRWAAQVSVATSSGDADEGFLTGEAAERSLWSFLATRGLPPSTVLLLPSLLPPLFLPSVGLLVFGLWTPRERRLLGATLWLGFSTGDLESVRGIGVAFGAWSHPETALLLIPVVGAVLAAGRLPLRGTGATVVCLLPLGAMALAPAAAPSLGPASSVLLLTLDQVPWLVLGALGLRRGADAPTRALVVGGAGLVLLGAWRPGWDQWGGYTLYRLGLLLASVGPTLDLAERAGRGLKRLPALSGMAPRPLGTAALVLAFVPGSALAWWSLSLDPMGEASLQPPSQNVGRVMAWIRTETPPDAVFVAGPTYAPQVAVLAGRRVLRAPGLGPATADDGRRRRMERIVLAGRDPGRLGRLYGLRYVLVAPGDFRDQGIEHPADLISRPGLRPRFLGPGGLSVFEIVGKPAGGSRQQGRARARQIE